MPARGGGGAWRKGGGGGSVGLGRPGPMRSGTGQQGQKLVKGLIAMCADDPANMAATRSRTTGAPFSSCPTRGPLISRTCTRSRGSRRSGSMLREC